MIVLSGNDISVSFGGETLFHDVNFRLEENGRAGLVGVNGCGKTTLMHVINGRQEAETGGISKAAGIKLGCMEQYVIRDDNITLYDEVLEIFRPLIDAENELADIAVAIDTGDHSEQTLSRQMQLQERFEREGGLTYKSMTCSALVGLGFSEDDFNKPISVMSGGQKSKAQLAKLLLSGSNILLLDEPTNHLDITACEWLEKFLTEYKGAYIVISHDRYFLDRACSEIIEIDNKQIYSYKGNYSYYLEKRQERIDATNAEIARANNLYRTELEWMRRMPQARGHKARYREEAFYELEKVAKQRTYDTNVKLDVKASYIGSKIFEADHLCKSFGDIKILDDFSYIFARYEKMGIVGNNGTGKSTFIKILMGLEKPDSGTLDIGETVRFGYYSQDGLKFDEQMKVIDVITDIAEVIELGNGKRLTASQFLQHFLFTPETQHSYVYKLSGGERRRLYLCTVLMKNPNFLVLDEPTNDLDIVTLQVLEEYLQNFKGCVIVVSHDRYFMDKVVDHLLVFKGQGDIRDFPGNYSDYREWKLAKAEHEKEAAKPKEEKTQRVRLNDKRRMTFKERKEFEQLEKDIAQLEAEKKALEEALCSGSLSVEELTEKSKRLPALNDELDEKSMRWLELSEIEG